MPEPTIERSAILSPDGLYRYRLSRWWDKRLPWVTFLMINPSTADALVDDPTIRKCIGFAQRWGFGGIEVVNLFAWRSSDPLALVDAPNPIGPEYMKHLYDSIEKSALLVVAWGCESTLKKKPLLTARPKAVLAAIRALRPELSISCLGMSKTGNPYHPLMLAYDTPCIPYEVTACSL